MAYTRGSSANIIVGAAALFTYEPTGGATQLTEADLPDVVEDVTYKDTLQDDTDFRNVGYTMNGLGNCFPARLRRGTGRPATRRCQALQAGYAG
jgi:hypothetical protein